MLKFKIVEKLLNHLCYQSGIKEQSYFAVEYSISFISIVEVRASPIKHSCTINVITFSSPLHVLSKIDNAYFIL